MRKIGIFLGAEPGSGGMFQYSLSIVEALAASGRYSTVAAYFNPEWTAYLQPLGVRMLDLGGRGRREPFTLGRIWRTACLPANIWRKRLSGFDPVARKLANERCEVWFFPAQDHWSYLVPVPAVVTIHDLMHRYEPRFPEVSRLGRYFAREYRFRNICRFAKGILVDSELGRTHVMDSYGEDSAHVFSLPYLPPRYIYERKVPPDFDKRYQLPRKFLFYPAQFWSHKNHDRLLQALSAARDSCPDVFLVLVGPKRHEYKKVVRRVAELGLRDHVMFSGYVPDADLAEFYRRARALVMPTFFGPTNIPPLEAFACGCPAAVSNVYGMQEQVGEAALTFNPSSVNEIAEVVRELWMDDDLCLSLRVKGYERDARWGQTQFADRLHEFLERLDGRTPVRLAS